MLVIWLTGLVAASLLLGWAGELLVVEVLAVTVLGEVPAPELGLGLDEMASMIHSLSLVILEYTPGLLA